MWRRPAPPPGRERGTLPHQPARTPALLNTSAARSPRQRSSQKLEQFLVLRVIRGDLAVGVADGAIGVAGQQRLDGGLVLSASGVNQRRSAGAIARVYVRSRGEQAGDDVGLV